MLEETSNEIDLVNLGLISAYLFKNDLTYKLIPENLRSYNIEEHNIKQTDVQKNELEILWKEPFFNNTVKILKKIITHYWSNNINFSLIDVGCNYGLVSITLANFIKNNGKTNKIFAFDCGLASSLCKKNIELNQLEDIITFEKKAICDGSYAKKVYFDHQHTEDNHIVKREGIDLPFYEINGMSLDEYFHDYNENFIIKIDTQGAEPLVFDGMRKILNEKFPTVLFEFTPWAYKLTIKPIEFFNKIPHNYTIFNVNGETNKIEQIEKAKIESFITEISKKSPYWTDLLLIHESTKKYDELLNQLKS